MVGGYGTQGPRIRTEISSADLSCGRGVEAEPILFPMYTVAAEVLLRMAEDGGDHAYTSRSTRKPKSQNPNTLDPKP